MKGVMYVNFCDIRLASLTEVIGPMLSQRTLGTTITDFRSFVSGVDVDQKEVERWVVNSNMVEASKLAREARLAARNNSNLEETGGDKDSISSVCRKSL